MQEVQVHAFGTLAHMTRSHGNTLVYTLPNMEEDNAAAALNSIVTEFHSYEDFLDSQITSLDLYYLEVMSAFFF